jgi:predicted MFS family arabinose efflux permease
MRREEKYLLWSSNFWSFGAGLFGPLFAVFTENVGGDVLAVTNVWGIYLVTMGLGVIVVGKFSDASEERKHILMLSGYGLNAVLTFGYLYVRDPLDLLFLQIGLGIAVALSAPTWSALYDKYSGIGKDGYMWGLSSGFEKIATGLAVLLGGVIVTQLSFTSLFIIMGAVQTVAFFVQLRMFLVTQGR